MPILPPYTCKKKRLIREAIPEGLCKLQTNSQFPETWHGRESSSLLESVAMPLYLYLTQEYNTEVYQFAHSSLLPTDRHQVVRSNKPSTNGC